MPSLTHGISSLSASLNEILASIVHTILAVIRSAIGAVLGFVRLLLAVVIGALRAGVEVVGEVFGFAIGNLLMLLVVCAVCMGYRMRAKRREARVAAREKLA